ncbi:hypothetical protein B0A55_12587 [Friedmanniomyces simplex]|uniref:Uncharacterized protein n=1 Tax=Friedmanniomyces simplex TaxID=329884 RepID=A0A4U0WA71_9PEZI|nr:hypothetical protein B0A55_12587 [Friedmanniomyces simplex]
MTLPSLHPRQSLRRLRTAFNPSSPSFQSSSPTTSPSTTTSPPPTSPLSPQVTNRSTSTSTSSSSSASSSAFSPPVAAAFPRRFTNFSHRNLSASSLVAGGERVTSTTTAGRAIRRKRSLAELEREEERGVDGALVGLVEPRPWGGPALGGIEEVLEGGL